jgi:hypothetical protein
MSGLIQPTRRALVGGIAALIASPAIVRASSIMPISTSPVFAQEVPWQRWIIKVKLQAIAAADRHTQQPVWLPVYTLITDQE